MKITDIKSYPVWVGHRNQMIVKVETDEGIYGWGEAGVSGRELAVDGAVRHYREFLIGEDPMRIDALWQTMYRSQYFEGGRILDKPGGALEVRPQGIHAVVKRGDERVDAEEVHAAVQVLHHLPGLARGCRDVVGDLEDCGAHR